MCQLTLMKLALVPSALQRSPGLIQAGAVISGFFSSATSRTRSISPTHLSLPPAVSPESTLSPLSASAIEARISSCLESRLDQQFEELLATLRTGQPAHPATVPYNPSPSVLLQTPTAHNHPTGESLPLSTSRCFPWVTADILDKVAQDKLHPEELVKLRNPESKVSREPTRSTRLVLKSGQLTLTEDSSDTRTSTFAKAIPNVAALTQVWLVYVAIRLRYTHNHKLAEALLAHLEYLIDYESTYTWRAVVDYHLAVCRLRFGTGAVHEWADVDNNIAGRVLLTNPRMASLNNSSTAQRDQAPPNFRKGAGGRPSRATTSTSSDTCHRFNAGHDCAGQAEAPLGVPAPPLPSSWDQATPPPRASSQAPLPPNAPSPTQPPQLSIAEDRIKAVLPLKAPPQAMPPPRASPKAALPSNAFPQATPPPRASSKATLPSKAPPQVMPPPRASPKATLLSNAPPQATPPPRASSQATLPSNASPQATPPSRALSPRDILAGIIDMPPDLATPLLASILTAAVGTLNAQHWSPFLILYPDQAFAAQLRGVLLHGVKLGYEGPLRHKARLGVKNLPMDSLGLEHLCREISSRVSEGRLCPVVSPDAVRLVCSPMGVVPKLHSDKLRTIYHLSHPRLPGTHLPSVNSHIDTAFVAIKYNTLDTIMDYIREHPGALLWKADLEDAFRHVVVAESDARLMGIQFEGAFYQECALAFGGSSSPFLFNLFVEFLHWLAAFTQQSISALQPPSNPQPYSVITHYLNDFFGAVDAGVNANVPIAALSLAASALGFKLSRKKTVWNTTRLEVLGIELDLVAQTASVTESHRRRILQSCERILDRGATRTELSWWVNTLSSWDGVSLLQPSPLLIEHVWMDASKRSIGAHLGTMHQPIAVLSREISRRHRNKDIRFLEVLAVLEALRLFSPLWSGPRWVVVHVDNENVEHGLRKGSIRNPATQTILRAIFTLCLQRHINLVPLRVSSEENILADTLSPSFKAATRLSAPANFLLWNSLAFNTRSRSRAICADFVEFTASPRPFPATESQLIEWVVNQHTKGKSYSTVRRDLAVLKLWHVDIGAPTPAFDSERLTRVVRGFKRVAGDPLPTAKLPITLPFLWKLVRTLPSICTSPHDRHMFRAAFCLAFACFLRAGELMWGAEEPSAQLTVGSVSFAMDHSHATITLPASKTDPFRQGAKLTAPAVRTSTCAVSALEVICAGRPTWVPLFTLEGGLPFSRGVFTRTLCQCLLACDISPADYSGHSFRRGAATWAAANGVDDDTIRRLGRWKSDCFWRYINKSASDRAATTAWALSSAASRTRSISPAHLSPPPAVSPESTPSPLSAAAIEARISSRLESRLDQRFEELLATLRTGQPAHPTTVPYNPSPSIFSQTPTAHNHPTGESPPLSTSRCFPWVTADILEKVAQDKLRPEELVKLRNPESKVSREPTRSTGLVLESGQLTLTQDSSNTRTSTFAKAIPNVAALTQVWLAYVAIRLRYTRNHELAEALLAHLEYLIDYESTYTWRAVVDYHLAVCRLRFGTGAVHEWADVDNNIAGRVLLTNPRTASLNNSSTARQDQAPPNFRKGTGGRQSRATTSTSSDTCRSQAEAPLGVPAPPFPSSRDQATPPPSAPSPTQPPQLSIAEDKFKAALPLKAPPQATPPPRASPEATLQSTVPPQVPPPPRASPKATLPSNAPLQVTPPPRASPEATLQSTVPPQVTPPPRASPKATLPSNAPLQATPPPRVSSQATLPSNASPQAMPPSRALSPRDILAGIIDLPPDLATPILASILTGRPPAPRPNTSCAQPIFDQSDTPAAVGTLNARHWSPFLNLYPDQAFAAQLRGALLHGVKLGYEGPLRHEARLGVKNLPMDSTGLEHLRREISSRVSEGRLRPVVSPDAARLVCSPMGVVPKPHSDKLRTIYHLSHPRTPGTRLPSVNSHIDTAFVAIKYDTLDAIMDYIREHPGALLWKANLEDAFRHVVVAESDARLMGIQFEGAFYQECALAFGGSSSPFLFNLFAEFLHWLAAFTQQSISALQPPSNPQPYSVITHYLDDFFGAADAGANANVPIAALSLAASALGFRLSRKKTVWNTTRLEKIAGLLQFITRVVPQGRAFLRRLYDAVKARYKTPFERRISSATWTELSWWVNTLSSWDGVSLLQPSPLLIEHIWTDASKHSIGAHLGTMRQPIAVLSREVSRRHHNKDIRFLEALAVLEALRLFSPLWSGPRRVVVHVDNENVEHSLRKGSIRDPATQTILRAIFTLCLQRHIDLVPLRVSSEENILADAFSRRRFHFIEQHYPTAFSLLKMHPPASFKAATRLSAPANFLLWNGLAINTRSRSRAICADFAEFTASPRPFPATEPQLIEWVANQHTKGKSYSTVRRDLAVLKSWHIDIGVPTSAFDSERLARVVRGFKRVAGDPLPTAKLPITLPLLRKLVRALPSICTSPHDRRMFRAAFCLAFACFLRAGELTWGAEELSGQLTVGSVSFATDRSHATITLPASKTDPFRRGAKLTAPAVRTSTCAVSALEVICAGRPTGAPLFTLEGGLPFSREVFMRTLRQCLRACDISPADYSGHSFRQGAATWAAANGVDDDTIRGLGRWKSDCFRRYIDKSASDRAATTARALYSHPHRALDLSTPAWRDI
uniref:Tyr recombinase domain-containing protein n=1 Tax=Ustilago esculenta TaxID=185366 RepID=A0A481SH38_9BASI|nr:hypothetical protein UEMT_2037 [Ustilago esculenta]